MDFSKVKNLVFFYVWLLTQNDCMSGYEEKIINNNLWCVDSQEYNIKPNKSFEKTISNNSYYIEYYTYFDYDEFCSINLKRFEESLKVNIK